MVSIPPEKKTDYLTILTIFLLYDSAHLRLKRGCLSMSIYNALLYTTIISQPTD